ncbi:MAG: hypothetical protein JSR41_00990 [Proteobacteria bacterium]|nr:hypothetical protein [Pseudomonadota bacterium]
MRNLSVGALTLSVAAVLTGSLAARAADGADPVQAETDRLNRETARTVARTNFLNAQAALHKAELPDLPESAGKAGTLTVEEAGRDKFHVTARTAEAFETAAGRLATMLDKRSGSVTLLTDADRASIPAFWTQRVALSRVRKEFEALLGPQAPPAPQPEAAAAALMQIGPVLSFFQQLSRIAKTDKGLSFTDAEIPDDFLLELVASKNSSKFLYPAAGLDSVLINGHSTDFMKEILHLEARVPELTKLAGTDPTKKVPAAAAEAKFDALVTSLMTADAATKLPLMVTVIRGELASTYLTATNRVAFSVRVAAKGGASLKTSNWWRNDRLFASGGVSVLYRLVDGNQGGQIVMAGVVNAETPFVQVPLD